MTNKNNVNTEVQETTTALALTEVDNSIFKVQAEGDGQAVRYSTTYEDTDLFNAVNGGSEPVKNYLDKEVEVTDIIITSADVHEDVNDEDSPVVSKPCVHFLCTDGKHLATLSNGVIKSAKNLIACGFAPSEGHSIIIKFRTVETKKGTAHTFDLVKRN